MHEQSESEQGLEPQKNLLSCMQVKKCLRKQARHFLVHVSESESSYLQTDTDSDVETAHIQYPGVRTLLHAYAACKRVFAFLCWSGPWVLRSGQGSAPVSCQCSSGRIPFPWCRGLLNELSVGFVKPRHFDKAFADSFGHKRSAIMSDDEMEDYGFEYSDEDEVEEDVVDIENQYYNSKGLIESDDPKDALKGFHEVVNMEGEKGDWGFKALKQIIKLQYTLGDFKGMMDSYRDMLKYIKGAVTRNVSEKKINSLLDFVSQSTDMQVLQEFYGETLKSLEEAKNERLWFKTQLKLCTLWFNLKEYGRAQKILKLLHQSCQNEDGTDDMKKGTQLLEVYALEIQIHTELKNNKQLKELYKKALEVKSAIPHPRIMGIIRECGGKMHMMERIWVEAATDFFEAFKSYDEAGAMRRVQCLKYLVLAYMLMESTVDPFDAQEAKPYKNDTEVLAMTDLVQAYQRNDITAFEKILKANRKTIYDDPFIRQYIDDLLKNIRTSVVLHEIQPYTRVGIPFISKELHIPEDEVEQLLAALILDQRIHGSIDQVKQVLELSRASEEDEKYQSLQRWSSKLTEMHHNVLNRLSVG